MAIIKCPECGQSVSDMAEQCPNCGYPIHTNIMKCPECGNDVPKNMDKCPNCGFPIKEEGEKKEEQKKKKKKITIISIVAAILIIVIGSVYFIYHTNTVKEQENAAWTQLQTSTNVIDFDHFISEFPNGQHAEDAKILRTKLV